MLDWTRIIGDVMGIAMGLGAAIFNESFARQVAATRQPFMSTDYSKYLPRVRLFGKIVGPIVALIAAGDLIATLYGAIK